MDNKYGHMIYTRCGCSRTIDGREENKDGYGIYYMTSNIAHPSGECDRDLQEKVIGEMWDVDSYIYVVPDVGMPILSKIHIRTDEERELAKQSKVDNRCEHINEILVGKMQNYPFEYFDSSFWKAADHPIADYYKDKVTELGQPVEPENVEKGSVTRKQVMAFANDGRINAIQAAVWALLKQYDMPSNERKFIVIRDTEENVRKWIAAICYSFPIDVARRISFCTNMSNINKDTITCYYIDKSTQKYVRMRNMQDPNQEKRCYVMIVGVDPNERNSSRTAEPMENSPYLVIDGNTKSAKFTTDELISRSYIKSIGQDDSAIENFCKYMNEMINIPIGSSLVELFDAQRFLEKEVSWNYSGMLNSLMLLTPHFTQRSVLMLYVMDRLCNGNGYETMFAQEDEKNGLKLLGMLMDIAQKFSISSATTVFQHIVNNRFSQMLADVRKVDVLRSYLQCLRQKNAQLYYSALKEIVISQRLTSINLNDISSAPKEYVNTVYDIINECIINNTLSWSVFLQSNDYHSVSRTLIARSITDEEIITNVLSLLAGDVKAIDLYIKIGSEQTENENKRVRWWRTLLANNISVDQLCALIAEGRIGERDIEAVLCHEIRIHGFSEHLRNLFNQYLARVPGVGENFYKEWIKSLTGSPNRMQALNRVLSEISANSNYSNLLIEVLQKLDNEIQLKATKENLELVRLINDYAVRARVNTPNTALWQYLNSMTSVKISHRDKDGVAGLYQKCNVGGYRYPSPNNLLDQPLFQSFQKRMMEYCDEPAAHLIMMMSFELNEGYTNVGYIKQYAKEICIATLKRKSPALAVAVHLTDAIAHGMYLNDPVDQLLPQFDHSEMQNQMSSLIMAIQDELGEVRTDGLMERIVANASRDYGQQTASHIEQIFKNAQNIYKQKHKNALSGLFDLLKGNKK